MNTFWTHIFFDTKYLHSKIFHTQLFYFNFSVPLFSLTCLLNLFIEYASTEVQSECCLIISPLQSRQFIPWSQLHVFFYKKVLIWVEARSFLTKGQIEAPEFLILMSFFSLKLSYFLTFWLFSPLKYTILL